jgi:hypothetical protein
MRCEECLPLIEEYFDGEIEGRTGELLAAHLATCVTCAAALDALSFEQEIYARYDRGLEVTPALWAAVSAEIAREPLPSKTVERPLFLSGLRAWASAALAALAARPALASTLALLIIGVTAGALRLTHQGDKATRGAGGAPTGQVASDRTTGAAATQPRIAPDGGKSIEESATTGHGSPSADSPFSESSRFEASLKESNARRGGAATVPVGGAGARERPTSVDRLIDEPLVRPAGGIIFISADDHARPEGDPSLVETARRDSGAVVTDARLPDTGGKELARHVEQAQMLLRSFKNARPSDDGRTINVAYEKSLSRKLLAENSTLQLDAETRYDRDTKQVLDRIEPYLLDIANMRDNPSREEVRSISERIDRKEIIAALQVY